MQHLVAIDAGMRTIRGDTVGEWKVTGNGSAVMSGSSPVDYLTRASTLGLRDTDAADWDLGQSVAMFCVSETEDVTIRTTFEQAGELSNGY